MASNDPRRAPGRLLTSAAAADLAASEAFRPDAGQLIGHAVGQAVATALQRDMPQALAQAIWQVHPPRMCARCIDAFNQWEAENGDLIAAAITAAGPPAQPGMPPDWRPHLPEELQPLVPAVERAITAVNGTEVCKDHASEALSRQAS